MKPVNASWMNPVNASPASWMKPVKLSKKLMGPSLQAPARIPTNGLPTTASRRGASYCSRVQDGFGGGMLTWQAKSKGAWLHVKETYHAKAGMHAITSFPPPAFRASGPGGSELV